MKTISPFALGATLYMPATRLDLLDVLLGKKIPGLRSLVVCLEDAVKESDVAIALANLKSLLKGVSAMGGRPQGCPLVFIRPRDAKMAAQLNDWPLMEHVDGFVAPKLNMGSLKQWEKAVTRAGLMLMPTLETADVYDPCAMVDLREAFKGTLGDRIIALRIGGNDLMGCLGVRRSPSMTLYQSPLSYVIPMLCGVMGSQFALTAPVFERIDNLGLLEEELALDISHGLVGKTAIHPCQIETIHKALRVSVEDLNSARLILSAGAAAVFKHDGAMCEPATHHRWAQNIVERAHWHGVRQESPVISGAEPSARLTQAI